MPADDDVPTAKGPRPDAFVSYRRIPADTAFVDRLQDTLSARGKQLWVDRTDIEPAADSWERIAKGIRAAKAFIFVITPESVASRQCRRELDAAAVHHKLIVPVVLRDVDLEGLPASLSTPNWIYFTADRDFEESLGQVLRALENDLQWRDDHARLADRADEWARSGRDRSFVLHGRDLRSALEWLAGADQHRSVPVTDLQAEYIAASRKAAMRTRRAWRTALAAGLAIALGLTAYGLTESQHAGAETQQADRQHAIALSRLLASRSVDLTNTDPVAARHLAVAAWYEYPTDEAASAMAALLTFQERNGALPVAGARVVTFSPDGRVLATAGSDGIRLWDAATAKPVAATFRSASSVSAMAFSPDSRLLATGDADGYVRLWDAATGRLVGKPVRIAASRSGSFHPPLISSVAFSPDGTLLAIGDIAGYVRMLRPSNAEPAGEALLAVPERFGTGSVTSVAFSPHGRLLATAGSDGEVRLWNPATGQTTAAPLKVTEPDALSVTSVTFSPDGKLLATGDDYGVVRMWNPATGKPAGQPILANPIATELVPAGGGVNAVAFSPDGKMLASADADGGLRLWNTATGKAVGTSIPAAPKASNGVTSVAFNPRTGLLASASPDGYVRLWNAAAGSPIGAAIPYNPIDPQLSSYYLRLSSESTLLTTEADGYAETWTNPWTDPHPREAGQHDWSGSRLAAFSPDGKILAVTSYDGLHLTDPVTFADLSKPLPPSSDAYAVAFSPDGKLIAAAQLGDDVYVYDTATGVPVGVPLQPRYVLHAFITGVAISPDDKIVAAADPNGYVDTWRIASGVHVATALPANPAKSPKAALGGAVYSITFGPDGKLLASADYDGRVRLWNPVSGRPLGDLVSAALGHSPVESVAISPDGKLLASGYGNGDIQLWDLASRSAIGPPLPASPSGSGITELTFSPDGGLLMSEDSQAVAEPWQTWMFANPYAALCVDAGPPTKTEWAKYASTEPQPRACSGVPSPAGLK